MNLKNGTHVSSFLEAEINSQRPNRFSDIGNKSGRSLSQELNQN